MLAISDAHPQAEWKQSSGELCGLVGLMKPRGLCSSLSNCSICLAPLAAQKCLRSQGWLWLTPTSQHNSE